MSATVVCVDPGIPSLAVVLDAPELRRMLHQQGVSSSAPAQHLYIRLLRHHPGKRCVFEIADTPDGSGLWIGKVFAHDRADVYQTMDAIWRAGFGRDAEFSIPMPIAYLPDVRLLLQEKVIGRSATELFLSAEEGESHRISELCGLWLARLHTTAPLAGAAFDLAGYRSAIERWSSRIDGAGGELAEKARMLRAGLERAVAAIHPVRARTCHGSFTHHQVIAAPGRTVTFDWDDVVIADPAFDAARFVVGLRRLAWRNLSSMRGLDAAAEVFLDSYQAHGRADVTRNLTFYAAAICLRLAKKDVTHAAAQWSEKAEATLDEGLRTLDQGI